MYSRADRKFLNPEKDQASYPAPGTYLKTEKPSGKLGYAPFSSMAERSSYFEEQVIEGPFPGNYDMNFGLQSAVAPIFSRSKRFNKTVGAVPGYDKSVLIT